MSNLDEAKVKSLLHKLVDEMYSLTERNYRNDIVVSGIHVQIDEADILTSMASCATVKKANEAQVDTDRVLSVTHRDEQFPIVVKRTPKVEFTGRAKGVPENPGYQ